MTKKRGKKENKEEKLKKMMQKKHCIFKIGQKSLSSAAGALTTPLKRRGGCEKTGGNIGG